MRGIITICGSTKFKEQFEEVNRRLTFSGYAVLSVGSFHHSEKNPVVADMILARKGKLDTLHKDKISISRAIVVVNVGGYIGSSTKSEIAHARALGVKVYWYDMSQFLEADKMMKFPRDENFSPYDGDWIELLDESPDPIPAGVK